MKTTLSTIILDESIKAYLSEFTNLDTSTKTDTGKSNKNLAKTIAKDIIDSKSWFNDDESKLIASVKKINNVATFTDVNKIIKSQEGKPFSAYIATFISKDDWDTWYPIIKHLSKVIPKSQWNVIIKNALDKTNGISSLYIKDRQLAADIKKEISIVDTTKPTTWNDPDTYNTKNKLVGTAVIIAALSCWIGGGFKQAQCLKNLYKQIFNKKDLKDIQPVEVATRLQQLRKAPIGKNKDALIKIFKQRKDGGFIDEVEYKAAEYYILNGLTSTQLNKLIFENILLTWKTGVARSGDAKRIANIINNADFNKYMLPKLQAIEDDLIGVKKSDKGLGALKNRMISSKTVFFKIKPLRFDMENWLNIMSKMGTPITNFEKEFMRQVGKTFKHYMGLNRGSSPALIAQQSIDLTLGGYSGSKWWGLKKTKPSRDNFPIVNTWEKWISEMTETGVTRYTYYDTFNEFPSYTQWKQDMTNINVTRSMINRNQYDVQKFVWLNSKLT